MLEYIVLSDDIKLEENKPIRYNLIRFGTNWEEIIGILDDKANATQKDTKSNNCK